MELKFDIWQKGCCGIEGRMLCNHTIETITDLNMHDEINLYLLHSPFFDERGFPIVDGNFVKYLIPVDSIGSIETDIIIIEDWEIGLVQYKNGCFIVVNKDGSVAGYLKDISYKRGITVIGNRFKNKEFFDADEG